ncbi:MAG: hypothetical protein HYV26_23840 [Candidatus Hydrogenedentes bacterium]|nr:hypothetical protein [Candidatus Hydrogenedentota bacterium]
MHVNDFIPDLRRAAAELADSEERRQLFSALEAGWTSSSEMLGQIGKAIRTLEAETPELPGPVRQSFQRALAEIRKVWPSI